MSESSNYHNDLKAEQCYFCPATHDLEEHHIVPQRFDGQDDPINVVTVCKRCHKKLERLYDKRFYESLGLDDETGERDSHRDCAIHDCENTATHTKTVSGMKNGRHVRADAPRCEEHREQ